MDREAHIKDVKIWAGSKEKCNFRTCKCEECEKIRTDEYLALKKSGLKAF